MDKKKVIINVLKFIAYVCGIVVTYLGGSASAQILQNL